MTPVEAKNSLRKHIALVDSNGSKRTLGEKEIALLIEDHDTQVATNTALVERVRELEAGLMRIVDESVFNQQRFAEDSDTDYFLRCFGAVKTRARALLANTEAQGETSCG